MSQISPITVATAAEARDALQEAVDKALAGRDELRALEAGAGKRCRLTLPADAWVVGVDTDPVAIELNTRLDERVVGDLTHYTPAPASFDLITCWYVLEHVADPGLLLDQFAQWTAPGGVVVLAVPNLRSPKSVLTKLTPHPFHVWFRRRVLGFPNAGRPGFGPYPTTLRRPIAPHRLVRRFARHGFEPIMEAYFEDGKQKSVRRKVALTGWRWSLAKAVTKGASLGALDAARSEYVVAFQKTTPD